MAPRSGARSGSRALDAAIIDPAETANAARLAGCNLLSACDPGWRRYLWMAPNEERADVVLDRRWDRPRRGCRVAYHAGKTSPPARPCARYAGHADGSCEC